ncbi:MAG: rod shape-determining protein MreC [Betaproteobacteria bacterium RIFCSPLOWO2_02_FULL_65_24]|nr:MAG: rod shape-determining protein MreC [Betaproteobacteria bacterium RIFCSPLOWO2_02_FULL_65_24]OGA77650.1 MAG: rod shape-determining protein MreC [Betaproteobacteria bacterium RIFCSPLOWO2_12_FULL_66_14]
MDTTPPPFFNRGPAPLVRLTFFGLLAVLLMVLDARFQYTEPLRQVIALVAYPLQQAALAPVRVARATFDYFTSKSALEREIDELRARHLQVAKDLVTLEALAAENAQLRRLMEAREKWQRKSTLAEILYAGRDPFARRVVIDKGSSHGVRPGLAVIDELGVVGQVTRVHPMLSEVTLITDKNQAIPVQVVRNGLRAVAFGSGDGETLDLRFMAANADVQNGDLLVTSGIDGTYPQGLPVARVARIERDAAYVFAKISLVPAAGTDRYRHVLVLSQDSLLPPPPPEAETDKDRPSKMKRPRVRRDA